MMVSVREWIGLAAAGVEILAVAIIVLFIVAGTAQWVLHLTRKIEGAHGRYRVMLGKSLLIGLELLVAADIIRTVALDLTPTSLALLGGLVVVRTFLGWTLTLEVEGRWPWQRGQGPRPGSRGEAPSSGTSSASRS